MTVKDDLIEKFNTKKANIGIVGLGYVGLPLAIEYIKAGYSVTGFDIDQSKVESLINCISYIEHIDISELKKAHNNDFFKPTTDYSKVTEVDAVILCVPTPLNDHREPDLSFVIQSLESVIPGLKQGQIVSLESTTYPGTTDEELRPRIEKTGLIVGEDIFLIYSSEREDPNNPNFTIRTIPKVCGGTTTDCMQVGKALYENVIDEITEVSSTQAAEMSKIIENTFRAVNIALVNELKMDIDIFEVIRAAATKPFGFMPFYPGPGLGGLYPH